MQSRGGKEGGEEGGEGAAHFKLAIIPSLIVRRLPPAQPSSLLVLNQGNQAASPSRMPFPSLAFPTEGGTLMLYSLSESEPTKIP